MKRIFSVILAVMMLVLAVPFAASANTDVTVTLDGKVIDCNVYGQPATIVEGRTLVPLRAIFEALGATVEWDPKEYIVTSTLDNITISLKIGEKKLHRNGATIELDVPAMLMNDRTMVPVRAISESFGILVEWNNATRTVVLLHEKSEVINPGSGIETAENSAVDVMTDYLDAAQDFNFTKLAKYCVDSHGMEKLGVSNVKQALDKIGFTQKAFSDKILAESYKGNEDYRPIANAVAKATYNYIVDAVEKMYYKIDGVKAVDSKTTEIVVMYYSPDFDSVGEMFKGTFNAAMLKAFANGTISFDMSQTEMMTALAPIVSKELEEAFDSTLDKDKFILSKTDIFTLVKGNNGKWLVEFPENDIKFIEAMKKGSFEGIIESFI